ncbi:MAG: aminoglycoside phosphotransferase family protein [Candidatus Omnitrophica bacterium]|nr:aminoglycoside phosphotransferase family protein [Candidatus Omnitrophota bacterium]
MENSVWRLLLKSGVNGQGVILEGKPIDIKNFEFSEVDAVILNLLTETDIDVLNSVRPFCSLVKQKGQICIVFGNKYSYLKLKRHRSLFFKQIFFLGVIKRILLINGFRSFKVYFLRPRGQEVFDIADGIKIKSQNADFKEKILNSVLFQWAQPAYVLIADKGIDISRSFLDEFNEVNGLKGNFKCLMGHPNTLLLIFEDKIARFPLDRLSEARCRLNNSIIKRLAYSSIAGLVPKSIKSGRFNGQKYFLESRINGKAFDEPRAYMNSLLFKAAGFITKFHKNNANEIIIDNNNYKKLFGRGFKIIGRYLKDNELRLLNKINNYIKENAIGKKIKTVMLHGDFKIENVLFETNSHEIQGVIDWDLSEFNGLPFLDIFYLLIYKDNLFSAKPIMQIFRERFLFGQFNDEEEQIISAYFAEVGINKDWLEILLIMCWVHHISKRYAQQLRSSAAGFKQENITGVMNKIFERINIYV